MIHNIEFADLARIRQLASTYRDLDPDFAAVALLALAERLETLAVLTVDARDFSIDRLRSGKRLVNLLDERT